MCPCTSFAGKQMFSDITVPAPFLIQRGARGIGELDFEAALDQQRVPEREILVHVHRARHAKRQPGRPGRLRRPVEEQLELPVGQAGASGEALAVIGIDPLAAVAGVENAAVGESQLGDGAAVLTAPALDQALIVARCAFQRFQAYKAARAGRRPSARHRAPAVPRHRRPSTRRCPGRPPPCPSNFLRRGARPGCGTCLPAPRYARPGRLVSVIFSTLCRAFLMTE